MSNAVSKEGQRVVGLMRVYAAAKRQYGTDFLADDSDTNMLDHAIEQGWSPARLENDLAAAGTKYLFST